MGGEEDEVHDQHLRRKLIKQSNGEGKGNVISKFVSVDDFIEVSCKFANFL